MTQTTTLTARCRELFGSYPEAAEIAAEQDFGGVPAMTLMLAAGGSPRFFRMLDIGVGFAACERGATPVPLADGTAAAVRKAITSGWPLPADGSLYGSQQHGLVSALIISYTSLDLPVPGWSLCPHADMPGCWPPFVGERLLGPWFWAHLRVGNVVDLGPLVARTRGAIFGIPVGEGLGVTAFAAKADVDAGGLVLPRGVYAYHSALRASTPLPPLDDLLADPARVDLGPRFPIASLRSKA